MIDKKFINKVNALIASSKMRNLDFDDVVARVLVDHFSANRTPGSDEIAHFESLGLNVLDHVSPAAAQKIAVILSPLPHTPPKLLERLVGMGAEAATHVLAHAPCLPSTMLSARADRGALSEALAIAQRASLDSATIAALARRPEIEPLRALAARNDIILDHGALLYLTQRARVDAVLGQMILSRTDVGLDLSSLFLWANSKQRIVLMAQAKRAALKQPPTFYTNIEGLRHAALAALAQRDNARFTSEIARGLGAHRTHIDAIIQDEGGEAAALLLVALTFSPEAAAHGLFQLRPDLAHKSPAETDGVLDQALAISASAAYHILRAMTGGRRTRAPQKRGAHNDALAPWRTAIKAEQSPAVQTTVPEFAHRAKHS